MYLNIYFNFSYFIESNNPHLSYLKSYDPQIRVIMLNLFEVGRIYKLKTQ